jgi:hypothetical protein
MVHPRQKLPAWYYRVLAVSIKEDREIYPKDFDEDLSDLEDDSEEEQEEEEDDDNDNDDDKMSDRSYNRSDADCYYELKEEREERKRELQKIREYEQKAKEKQQRFERNKEKEVQSACEAFKSGKESKTAPLKSIASKTFRLHSTDHVKHCYNSDVYKYIEFYCLDEDGQLLLEQGAGQINRHIYFNLDNFCNLRPFSPPKHASLDNCRLQDFDAKYDLTIQFLSNDYLKLKVGRELVLKNMPQPPHAPEFFEFVGISSDREKEKEKAERERREGIDRFAPPLPRESWFEMNHPMGW